MGIELTRRGILTGAALLAASPAAAVAMADEAGERGWDAEFDVIVIGSGFTGMAAAIAALDEGAHVALLEQDGHPGGNSILCDSNAQFGGGTSIQDAAGVEDTPEAFYQEIMAHGGYKSNPTLLRSFTEGSVEMAEWLKGLGVPFNEKLKKQEMSVERTVSCAAYGDLFGGLAMWRYLNDALVERGGEVALDSRVTALVQAPDGTVEGVEVDASGQAVRMRACKGVIIAAGGWKGNVAMRKAWDPRWDDECASSGAPCTPSDGAMINAAVDCGAALTGMGTIGETLFQWGSDHLVYWDGDIDTMPEYYTSGLPFDPACAIAVDGDGLRFVDETCAQDYGTQLLPDAYLSLQKRPRNVWGITDSRGAAAMGWTDDLFENPGADGASHKVTPGWVAKADTLEALAQETGVDAAGLQGTVERYNGFVGAGVDEDFGKEAMSEIAEGPFYAAKFRLYCHDQMSGLVANTKGQVLKRSAAYGPDDLDIDECDVIPHLYAAGESVGGYWGDSRGHGKIAAYMLQGRNAARAAMAE